MTEADFYGRIHKFFSSSKKVLMEVMVFEALKTKSHNFMLKAKQGTLIEARQGEPASQQLADCCSTEHLHLALLLQTELSN